MQRTADSAFSEPNVTSRRSLIRSVPRERPLSFGCAEPKFEFFQRDGLPVMERRTFGVAIKPPLHFTHRLSRFPNAILEFLLQTRGRFCAEQRVASLRYGPSLLTVTRGTTPWSRLGLFAFHTLAFAALLNSLLGLMR
jgi:hypothetical protein